MAPTGIHNATNMHCTEKRRSKWRRRWFMYIYNKCMLAMVCTRIYPNVNDGACPACRCTTYDYCTWYAMLSGNFITTTEMCFMSFMLPSWVCLVEQEQNASSQVNVHTQTPWIYTYVWQTTHKQLVARSEIKKRLSKLTETEMHSAIYSYNHYFHRAFFISRSSTKERADCV